MQCRHPEACSVYGTYWCPGFRDVNRSCLSGGTKHFRSTLSNQPAPDWRRPICIWALCTRSAHAHYLFTSTVNTNLSSSPFPPPPQRLLRTAP